MLVAGVLLLAGVLAAAGVSKLRQPAPFRAALGRLVPGRLVGVLAATVPALELGLAVALLTSPTARVPVAATALLLLVFSAALIVLAARGEQSCACLGDADASRPAAGLVRNGALLLVAAAVLLTPGAAAPLGAAAAELVGAGTVALGIACLWVLAQALIGAGARLEAPGGSG